jgi:hypothetical protein
MVARLTAAENSDGEPVTVVVSGAPGIGKSALAHHVAHLVRDSFPAGRLLVRMVHPDGVPRSSSAVAEDVAAALRDRRPGDPALLVLDDVVDADQVRPVLSARLGGAAIVTSRMGLASLIATHGGWVHRLSTFDDEDAHRLLLAVLGAERVEAEPEAARRLAAACGHYPLALRIMAARLLTRPGLRLADGVDWLAEDPLARLSLADSPRMSVAHVLRQAFARIDPRLAEAFVRIGRLPLNALRAQDCAPVLQMTPPEAESVLERLADAGFLEEGTPGPYRVHDLLRVYARGHAPNELDRTELRTADRTEKV